MIPAVPGLKYRSSKTLLQYLSKFTSVVPNTNCTVTNKMKVLFTMHNVKSCSFLYKAPPNAYTKYKITNIFNSNPDDAKILHAVGVLYRAKREMYSAQVWDSSVQHLVSLVVPDVSCVSYHSPI